MLVELVKDPTGAFMIGGGNRRLTVGTVENQHVELCLSPAVTLNQQRMYTLAMASEQYKGFHIFAWARPENVKASASVGIVYKPTRMGSIVEVQRIEGRSFESKEEAERYGLELCKEWIDKQKGRST